MDEAAFGSVAGALVATPESAVPEVDVLELDVPEVDVPDVGVTVAVLSGSCVLTASAVSLTNGAVPASREPVARRLFAGAVAASVVDDAALVLDVLLSVDLLSLSDEVVVRAVVTTDSPPLLVVCVAADVVVVAVFRASLLSESLLLDSRVADVTADVTSLAELSV
jgi:hypothetical protein